MPSSLVVPGANFTKFLAMIPPRADVAQGLYLFGSDYSTPVNLMGPTYPVPTIIGAPTFGTGYANFSQLNGINTNRSGGPPATYAVVAEIPATSYGAYVGHWSGGGGANEDCLYSQAGGSVFHALDGAARGTTITGVSHGSARAFMAASFTSTSRVLAAGKAGTLEANTFSYTSSQVAAGLTVGATGFAFETVPYQIALAVYWEAALTSVELAEVYEWAKLVCAARGVTVY